MKGETSATPCAEKADKKASFSSQIKNCTRILRERTNKLSNETEVRPEYSGTFHLLSSRGTYQPVYVVINYQECTLRYYANENSKTPLEKLNITFAYIQEINSVDKIMELNTKIENYICRYRAYIWANNKLYNFSSKTNDEFSSWIEPIQQISTSFSAGQWDIKQKAHQTVLPSYQSQEQYVILNYIQLMNTLERTILFSNRIKKLKQGYLSLKISDSAEPKDYYVYLTDRFIHICNLKDKKMPIAILSLKYLNTVELNEKSFILSSPIITATFYARHAADAKDWVRSIRIPLSSRKASASVFSEIFEDISNNSEGILDAGKTYYLNYSKLTFFGKKKTTYKLTKGITIIGRSRRNDVCLKDKKLSRNHIKVELEPGKVPMLSDLGSTFGTTVNNNSVTTHYLSEGDSIAVGDSIITVTCH